MEPPQRWLLAWLTLGRIPDSDYASTGSVKYRFLRLTGSRGEGYPMTTHRPQRHTRPICQHYDKWQDSIHNQCDTREQQRGKTSGKHHHCFRVADLPVQCDKKCAAKTEGITRRVADPGCCFASLNMLTAIYSRFSLPAVLRVSNRHGTAESQVCKPDSATVEIISDAVAILNAVPFLPGVQKPEKCDQNKSGTRTVAARRILSLSPYSPCPFFIPIRKENRVRNCHFYRHRSPFHFRG